VALDPQVASDLVKRAATGDRSAWEKIVDAYNGLIWSIAHSHGLDARDVADVTQTTWLRLVEHIDRLTEPDRVAAWLVTTARRESLRTKQRAERMILMGDLGLPVDATESVEWATESFEDDLTDDLVRAQQERLFQAAFAQLPSRSQQLMRLLMSEPAPSYAEVAEQLDIPVGSIGPTRMRCVAKMRRIISALASEATPVPQASTG
jgi:RNA polymerase sigma factor (sigma-70 family)